MPSKSPLPAAAIVLLLLNLGTSHTQLHSSVYYINPSIDSPCPQGVCFTFSQFASNLGRYLSNNTTLMMKQGKHSINSPFLIANVSQFTMISEQVSHPNDVDSTATITSSANFTFQNVREVYMNGLEFVGCTKNRITSVGKLILVNCTFNGLNRNGSAMTINNSTANITDSRFMQNQGHYHQVRYYSEAIVGGAITSINSDINIHGSSFERNAAETGGAIYIEKNSSLNLTNCEFDNNQFIVLNDRITLYNYHLVYKGSALFAHIRSAVVIKDSIFENSNDTIIENYSFGGIVNFYYTLRAEIQGCTYRNNSAIFIIQGDSSDIELIDAIFAYNVVRYAVIYSSSYSPRTSLYLSIVSCSFTRNYGNNTISLQNLELTILKSVFEDNKSDVGTVYLLYGSAYINRCRFSGNRARDFGAVLIAPLNNTIFIFNTVMSNNTVEKIGIILIHYGSLMCSGVLFLNNIAGTGIVAAFYGMANFRQNTILINNTGSLYAVASELTLQDNFSVLNGKAPVVNDFLPTQEGGAFTIIQSSAFFNGNVILMYNSAENGGALLMSESRAIIIGSITIYNNIAKDSGGGIHLFQSRLNLEGTFNISENMAEKGGGLYGFGSTITLQNFRQNYASVSSSTSYLIFTSNKAKFGGALYLSTTTKVYLLLIISRYVHQIRFIGNKAEFGGAIYIADETNSELCNSSGLVTTSSTECFIQLLALFPGVLDLGNQQLTLTFMNNHATSSTDAIFGGLFDRCTVNPLNPSRRQGITNGLSSLHLLSNINDTESDSIASYAVRLCFCKLDKPDCSFNPPPVNMRKGEIFKLSLVAVDQVNHTLESEVSAFLSSNDGGFSEGQQQQSVGTTCTDLTYNVFTPCDTEELQLHAVGPCGDAYPSQRRVQLIFDNCTCPIGFQLITDTRTKCVCECHSNLTNYVLTETCDASTASVQRKNNVWISYTNITTTKEYFLLIHPHCPYDYCLSEKEKVKISLSQINGDDEQCDLNRSGLLCGTCKPGFSVSFGSSRCIKCGRLWPLAVTGLILLAVIAGIGLVSALLFLNLTVAAGTINGILFYANIINGNASIFFNDLLTPSFPSVFIAWLNLDIGFDVCIYEGMDTYAKTWLQLVFPIYLIILVATVIIISNYSQRFSNLIGKKDPIATLATLILLSYAKLLSTIIAMLSLTTLQYPDGNRQLWKPDAAIQYLEFPKHALLIFVAIIILVVGAAYTITLLSWQVLIRLPNRKIFMWVRNPKLLSFIEMYNVPCKIGHQYWTGLLLLIRVILYLVSALNESGNSQVPLISITIAVGGVLILINRNVYKKAHVNSLEMAAVINLLVFTAFTWYATDVNDTHLHNSAAYISVVTTFILLLIVILYHIYAYTGIGSMIKKTEFSLKLQTLNIPKLQQQQRPLQKGNDGFQIPERDVDIFALVDRTQNNNDPQLVQHQPGSTKAAPTVSTVEIPKPVQLSPDPRGLHNQSPLADIRNE